MALTFYSRRADETRTVTVIT